jgi:hypothetical protein
MTARAYAYMQDLGFSKEDIGRAWNGEASLPLRDARAQRILFDAARYHDAVARAPQARANAPTRVQKPGPSGQIAPQEDVDLRGLSNKLSLSGSVKDGAALLSARRSRSR